MTKQFLSSFGETSYPGKEAELRAEKEAKKEVFDNAKESVSDYNKISAAEGRSPVGENSYNSPKAEDTALGGKKTFKTGEDIIGENEDAIINKISERVEQEKASLAVIDGYGYTDLIERIFLTVQAKGNKREMDDVLDRTSIFIKQYQKLLGKHLGEDEESKKVETMFREIMGDVAYIKDENGERTELLSGVRGPQDAIKGKDKGDKIYYEKEGKNGRPYLSQEEADAAGLSRKRAANNRGNGHNNNYRKNGLNTVFSGLAKDLQAFNPFTGKKENIDKGGNN